MGHIHPMVPLATGLAQAGQEVVRATAPEACAWLEGYGFRGVAGGAGSALPRRWADVRA